MPWQSAYRSKELIGKDPRFVLAASGHVAGVINPPARNKRSYWTHDDLTGDAADWLEKAEERPGSWWPDWDAWMKRHSSGTVPRPDAAGQCQISGYRKCARAVCEAKGKLGRNDQLVGTGHRTKASGHAPAIAVNASQCRLL